MKEARRKTSGASLSPSAEARRRADRQGVRALAAGALLLAAVAVVGCRDSALGPSAVTVYIAVDRAIAAPIIEEFQRRSNIQVTAVYESDPIDAADLFGVLAGSDEDGREVIDVLWTSETIRATQLKYLGGLASYRSSNAASIPAEYRDFDAYWTGTAARLRVLAVDTARVAQADVPASVTDLVEPAWTGRFGMPDLDNWMSAFHVAALYSDLGDERADDLLRRMRHNGLQLLTDDAAVLSALRDGDLDVALTSSDAVTVAVDAGQSVTTIVPDVDGIGVPVLPGAVAMSTWATHPRAARALIDYLISDDVERLLSQSRASLVPLRPDVPVPTGLPTLAGVRTMPFHYARTATGLERARARAASIFDEPR